jgi:hypothetical protein
MIEYFNAPKKSGTYAKMVKYTDVTPNTPDPEQRSPFYSADDQDRDRRL